MALSEANPPSDYRIYVDTPEVSGKCEQEKQIAQKAQSGGSAHCSNVRFGS